MNRKMRAKVNNAAAKAKKVRREQKVCDNCGEELKEHVPVMVVALTPVRDHEETLH